MPRLFLQADLAEGRAIELDRAQSNYLLNVMRLKDGAGVLVFNGRDGEWRAEIAQSGRKACLLTPCEQMRAQTPLPDLVYCFAPLKHARLDYMVQKATEMGAGVLQPVMTKFTQSGRINLDRARANVIEACEQCGVIAVPEIREPVTLDRLLVGWQETEAGRRLVFCDEGEESQNPLEALSGLEAGPLAVLIGPEGGFAEEERDLLRRQDYVTPVPLGPRVLRADTAAVAALAIVQAKLGDWH
ncbi:16S rRNA (uracil(1498)-N(3))-methyltransferase [Breoghania sp.]|uniref:16S rRNA (uracil(1498)-N(3))-methyltransferase n=1 Tax=Breoghania sp. TaxID=2065378 RepID=UPI002AA76A3E|nr:16S rRNA (uracil(1498)-N(3))-methyltransferase [Breoghania sp.]